MLSYERYPLLASQMHIHEPILDPYEQSKNKRDLLRGGKQRMGRAMGSTQGEVEYSRTVTLRNLFIVGAWATIFLLPSISFACDYYASPNGGGNGLSQSSPFTVSNFWSVAVPGKTLCLLDGTYTGRSSMIGGLGTTADGKRGTQTAPITIRALDEGMVLIDGQGVRTPIWLYDNNWTIIEGVNARNGNNDPRMGGSVVKISAGNTIVRRVVAWDAGDTNSPIVGVTGDQNLLEDVAAFGIGRKVFDAAQGGDFTTCRRCWGRWEGSHFLGPKHTFTLTYNNFDMTIENSIGTWSGEKMMESYTLKCNPGDPAPDCGKTYSNYDVDQPYGIFTQDRLDGSNKIANSKILGSIAYITASDTFKPGKLIGLGSFGSLEITNSAAYIQPDAYSGVKTIQLNSGLSNLVASNLTSVGGAGMTISSQWLQSNTEHGSTTSEVSNVYTGTGGAKICKQYRNRVLTNEPLWPWPMDQRIHDAMIQAGRTPFYVTQKIESLFGPIPTECRASGDGQDTTPPAPPQVLSILGQ